MTSTDTSQLGKCLVDQKYNRSFTSIRSDSYSWKCLNTSLSGNFMSTFWRIGNGRTVRIWADKWILEEPLEKYPWAINMNLISSDLVSSMIHNNGDWNMERIQTAIPIGISGIINEVKRSATDYDCRDSPFLINGKYSVSLACDFNSKKSNGMDHKTSIPGGYMITKRIWWFAWKLLRDRLPTRPKLVRRNIISDDQCPMCGNQKETTEHWLIECPRSIQFWELFTNVFKWELHITDVNVIKNRLGKKGKMDIWNATTQALTAIGAWNLWKLRNDAVFNWSEVSSEDQLSIQTAVR